MGYDLNRNFPDPGLSNVVRQKETLDMIKFMRKHHFVISANFHSGAEVVNYPGTDGAVGMLMMTVLQYKQEVRRYCSSVF